MEGSISMKVAIISNDDVKIKAISRAFEEFFSEKCEVKAVANPSEVSKQPINDEIFNVALTRVCETEEMIKDDFECDYIVSAESGIIERSHIFFNFQVICIWNCNRPMFAFGISSGLPIQAKYSNEIKETSANEVMDKLFEGKEVVSYLSKGIFSREKMLYDATIMALTHFNWE